ncbi:MAG: HDOD domain-containing protein [Rhodocyclaceae bacterium]|nr:HDOD domain-containing protein [Rhodocyclaceae bacterium]MDZ4214221.1 HDOD domain-containing protein [Rhodocyclaceae bacterium]
MNRTDLYQQIAAEAERGELVFPTSAEVGLRIKRALDDPDASMDQAAKLIQAEPVLTARVVAMANSVSYNRSGREITDLKQAVSRLGFRTLKSLTMSVLTRQIAGSTTDPELKKMSQQLWEHTAHVSALCHVIARRVTHQDPETALLVGILHEVAGFYLIGRAQGKADLLAGDLPDWQGEGEMIVGRVLLKALGVPEAVSTAIEDFWEGYLAMPPTSLGDTLLLAEELAPVPSPLYWAPDGAEQGRPQLEIALDEETLSDIMAESAEDVQSLLAALK